MLMERHIYLMEGTDYIRRSVNIVEAEDLNLYSDTPHEQIRDKISRASRGKSGREELKYVLLKDIDDSWLQAIIDYEQEQRPQNKYLPIYLTEQKFRKNEK